MTTNGKKNTDDLQLELMNAPDIRRFLSDNQDIYVRRSFSELLQEMFQQRSVSKATLAKNSGISEVYLHQLFSGGRTPSRDRILCLCFGLTATLEEAQELLKGSGKAQLYPRERRDAIILYGLSHKMTLDRVNDMLFQEQEKTLC